MSSYWYDDNDVEDILSGNLENVEINLPYRKILVISQFNQTMQSDCVDIFSQLLGLESNRIDHQIKRMLYRKRLLFYLRKEANIAWNYMWFDLVHKYSTAIAFL